MGSNPTNPTKFMKKRKYLRWHPIKNDPTGAFRGDGCEKLNGRVMEGIHEHALKVNARIDRSRLKKLYAQLEETEPGSFESIQISEQIVNAIG